MAENEDGQEKTEEPSQRRLDKAREDGDVLSSKETFVFATTLMLLTLVPILQTLGPRFLNAFKSYFTFSDVDHGLLFYNFEQAFSLVFVIGCSVGIPITIAIILAQLAVGGSISFSSKGASFKGSRINPIKGLGRIFSVKGLVELGKSVLKVTCLGGITGAVIYFSLASMVSTLGASFNLNYVFFARTYNFLVVGLLVVLAVIALVDYLYSRHSWLDKLKMTRHELKEEHKQTEGSPEVKSKIKRLQMEASRRAREQSNSVVNVSDATVIVTNPTHFAVAIKFSPGSMSVPIILSMGRGLVAQNIIEKGQGEAITIFSSPLLARALYFTSRIGHEIDERLYTSVAAVLAYIIHTDEGYEMPLPSVEVPKDLQFNEFGRPI